MRAYLLATGLTLILPIVGTEIRAASPFVTNRSAPLSATGKMCGGNINLSQAVIRPYRPILPPVVAPPAISPSGANDLSPSIPNVPIVPIPPLNPPGGGDGDLCKGLSPEQRNQIPICKEDRP